MERWKRARCLGSFKISKWFYLLCFFDVIFFSSEAKGQDFLQPPPTIWVDRHWSIPEDEPVGTRVAHATSSDNTNLNYSLEPAEYLDGSGFFRIDSKSGAIYLNESLEGKKGEQYYVIISASSGGVPLKTEIWVQITGGASSSGPFTSQIPKKPGGSIFVNPGTIGHGGRPMINLPSYPPGLTFQPNVVTPAVPSLPPVEQPPPVFSEKPMNLTSTTSTTTTSTKATLPPEPNNKISETTSEISLKPNYPPYVTNSNKNIANHPLGVSGNETATDVTKPEVTYTINPGTNDLNDMETSKQTILNTTTSATDETNNIVVFTIVPIVIIFGVVPIVAASIWLVRRRTRVKKRPTKEMRKESAATTNSSMTMSVEGESPSALREWIKQAQSNRYESWNPVGGDPQGQNRWEFPRHHLQVGRILGEGCFGQVWQCEALNIDGKEGVTTVAVKTLKEGAGERERADLLSELAVMKMLDPHPHVVRLLGSCTEKDPIFLIMEYVSLGKLQSYLRNSRSSHYYPNLHGDSSSISSKDLTAFCYQIARGMEYLSSKGIIHRDLAARNILIDKERVCKVADFGFARDIVANHVYERKTDGRLPVRWMAPEALYDNIFTTKTDIWSFGVLMWEIITLGSTPYPGISAAEVMRKVREGYRLEKPDHCRRELYNIMYYCWAQNPDDRPTFSDLVNFLKHLLFSETDYIELDRFPDHDYYNYMSNQTSGEKL